MPGSVVAEPLLCVVGLMLLVLLMTMAVASLSASFAIFLVRERANKSKHVQVSPNYVIPECSLCMATWVSLSKSP